MSYRSYTFLYFLRAQHYFSIPSLNLVYLLKYNNKVLKIKYHSRDGPLQEGGRRPPIPQLVGPVRGRQRPGSSPSGGWLPGIPTTTITISSILLLVTEQMVEQYAGAGVGAETRTSTTVTKAGDGFGSTAPVVAYCHDN